MEFAQDDAGDMVVGDVVHVKGKALTVGISGISGDEVLSLGWVETGESINLTLPEAIKLRDEIDKIIRDRHTGE
ncbi:hypothetical protein [Arthrobacter mobilis]|uniref:Uncharacterized protein n=1 Tax=Arthrobacter mobilis TaxID=2724944 RepID=A0A7X6H9X0_9MICC|nr:hypothetical protein [Arthrobacter mobilis]NKX53164.1 hypothetical protein [Arthrobacter mobilis]